MFAASNATSAYLYHSVPSPTPSLHDQNKHKQITGPQIQLCCHGFYYFVIFYTFSQVSEQFTKPTAGRCKFCTHFTSFYKE